MANPLKDNFLRAGQIWMKIWTISGLTCLIVEDSSIKISNIKVIHSFLAAITFCIMAYFRYISYVFNAGKVTSSNGQVFTGCSSAICSSLMIVLSVANKRREEILLRRMSAIRQKYNLKCSKSILHYFPLSCILPCVTLILENISFAVMINPITLVSYCFSIYSFLFQGQIQYYSTVAEDGFKSLNGQLKEFENPEVLLRWDDAANRLRGFRLMYQELSNHSKNTDQLFSSRVVLTVGHNFVAGVLFTYSAISEYISPSRVIPGTTPSLVLSYWALCCFLNLYFMVKPCERVRKEALYTPIAVQSLSTRPGYKASFYDELRLFSSQLVLEYVKPTPHNFFILDNRMLLSTLGAASSSLAILLQLNMKN